MEDYNFMQLGTNEKLIKQYEYSTTNDGQKESFVLTDRRAVAIHANKRGEDREEIRVKDVTSVDSSYKQKKNINKFGLALAIIGLLMFVIGCAVPQVVVLLIGLVLVVGGIFIMLKLGKTYKAFYLELTTSVLDGHSVKASATTGWGEVKTKRKGLLGKLFGGAKKPKKVKVQIDETVAVAMMDEVSTAIWELQA